jgi:hypothetical protein
LRKDHLSNFGYKRQNTPSLDKITEENTIFETATKAFIPIGPEKIEFSCLKKGKRIFRKTENS